MQHERLEVEVRRSARRRRTVSAKREGDKIVVMIPAHFSKAEEEVYVRDMVARLEKQARRSPRTDVNLMARARTLSSAYLDGRAVPEGVRWVTNMERRWGSCTPSTGQIRLSHKLQEMPDWVVDYVLLHELAHLLEANHGARFWRLVDGYPRAERAKGYLEGVAAAAGLELDDF